MAYDLYLAERVRNIMQERKADFFEKKMMGGLVFMVDEKMCVGIMQDQIMCRLFHDKYEDYLKMPGCISMEFTGRPMKGYVFVREEGIDADKDLEYWVDEALAFNPLAKKSKKKGKKK